MWPCHWSGRCRLPKLTSPKIVLGLKYYVGIAENPIECLLMGIISSVISAVRWRKLQAFKDRSSRWYSRLWKPNPGKEKPSNILDAQADLITFFSNIVHLDIKGSFTMSQTNFNGQLYNSTKNLDNSISFGLYDGYSGIGLFSTTSAAESDVGVVYQATQINSSILMGIMNTQPAAMNIFSWWCKYCYSIASCCTAWFIYAYSKYKLIFQVII